jgi:hypothetical protein
MIYEPPALSWKFPYVQVALTLPRLLNGILTRYAFIVPAGPVIKHSPSVESETDSLLLMGGMQVKFPLVEVKFIVCPEMGVPLLSVSVASTFAMPVLLNESGVKTVVFIKSEHDVDMVSSCSVWHQAMRPKSKNSITVKVFKVIRLPASS